MAKKIQGITIEIDGNTTKLSDSLKSVNKNIYSVQSELKEVDRLLKLDPGNTDLIAQKQQLLSDAVQNTSEKLKTLRDAKKQADNQLKNGEIGADAFRELEREIAKTEQSLNKFKDQSKNTSSIMDKLKSAASGAQKGIKAVGDVGAVAVKGLTAVTSAATALGGALVAAEASTREYRSDLSKLKTNTDNANLNFEDMKDNLSGLVALTDESDSSIEALSNLMQTGFDDTGIEQTLDSLSGAIISFPDTLKIESLADGLQETLATGAATGQFGELLERCGMNLDDFNAGLANATTSAEKQEYILETLAKTGMADVNASYKEANKSMLSLKEAQFDFNDSLAKFGSVIEPVEAQVMSFAANALDSLATAFEEGGMEGAAAELGNVITDVLTEITNYMPQIIEIGTLIIQNLILGISNNLPQIIECIILVLNQLITTIISMLPQLLKLGIDIIVQLILGIAQQAPELIPAIIDCIMLLCETLIDNLDLIIDAGIELILALIEGIFNALPDLIAKLPELILKLTVALLKLIVIQIPKLGIEIVKKIIDGLFSYWQTMISKIKEFFKGTIFEPIINKVTDMASVGLNLVKGLWEGLKNSVSWIKNKIKGWVGDVLDFIKKLFGINSPAKTTMLDGKYLAQGLGVGIIKETPKVVADVEKAMGQLSSSVSTSLNPVINPQANSNPLVIQIENFNNNRDTDIQALSEELEFYRKNNALAKGGS